MRRVMESAARANGIADDQLVFLEKAVAELDGSEWGGDKIDLIVGEPNFSMNLLPWHNLLFWYCLRHISASKETKVGNALILVKDSSYFGFKLLSRNQLKLNKGTLPKYN